MTQTKSATKYVLDPTIKERLLSSQGLMGQIGDLSTGRKGKPVGVHAIKTRLLNDNPILTSVESMEIIRKVLNLPENTIIHVAVNGKKA